MKKINTNLLITFLFFIFSQTVFSADTEIKKSFKDNLRLTFDLSSRAINFSPLDEIGFVHAVGFDLHKVFSTDTHDIGTLILQGYLTRLDNIPNPPGFFDDGDDTEFIYRIFNFNYTALRGNLPNIRAGHFEVAYGLEHTIDTNGTLRQYQQVPNLGIKADWGVSLNNQHKTFEYEIGATTGGNQDLKPSDSSFVYSARIGTPRDENTVLGLSVYKSELNNLDRERLGVDLRYYTGLHGMYAEVSYGENDDQDILNGLLEWNYTNGRENQLYYVQLSYLSTEDERDIDGDSALKTNIGLKYSPNNKWFLSAQLTRDLSTFGDVDKKTIVSIQARYRF